LIYRVFCFELVALSGGTINHWEQITEMERLLSENLDTEFDPKVRKQIRNYILKTKYIDYVGRGMLSDMPLIGGILNFLL